ncbi:MAG: succinylglutamate desuccinylase/aspartoacylase family protein [Rhodobacter sp.]|nr:succinylglutamate desuccinylase/aspartoacylase family protein [Rhodobacter sp.]
MPGSLITSELDFDAEGKQTGFLRLPHSTHHSAYGWIPIPITQIKNGTGPTLLLIAGIHGDEFEGQIALTKLARDLTPDDIQGRLILLPMANAPAARAGLRTSPIDGGNLNRTFPGDPHGTPTQMIAHYLETELIPQADVLVDLHSGGASLYYPPTLLRGLGHSADETARLKDLQAAFDLPYAWVFTSGGGRGSTARTAMGASNRAGIVSIMAELGGAGALSKDILARTERGLKRILHALDMLPGYTPDPAQGTRELHAQGSVYARDAGVFEPFKDIGDLVAEGEPAGQIHDPLTLDKAPIEVPSPYAGIVLAKRPLASVEPGDAVFQIARDAEPR